VQCKSGLLGRGDVIVWTLIFAWLGYLLLFNTGNSGCSGTRSRNPKFLNKIRVLEVVTPIGDQVIRVRAIRVRDREFRVRDSGFGFYAQRDVRHQVPQVATPRSFAHAPIQRSCESRSSGSVSHQHSRVLVVLSPSRRISSRDSTEETRHVIGSSGYISSVRANFTNTFKSKKLGSCWFLRVHSTR
jgi:hypothetical protein